MKQVLITTIYVTLLVTKGFALDFYVSPLATGSGDGSIGNPWKLQQALSSPLAITNPKDTIWIWLRVGTYTNTFNSQTSFSCFTNGTSKAPIIFRNYKNERATIDGKLPCTLIFGQGNCSYTWFWGIEILNSDSSDRDHSNVNRLGNVYCTAENIKFINLIVHDMGSGLDSWKTAYNSEIYGCIVYNIGNNLLNVNNWEGHGHGMYLQNDTIGTKSIHNNIIFSTFGNGIKVWQTTTTDAIGNFDIQRNIIFNGGAASENLGGPNNNSRTHNFFVVSNSKNNPIRNTVIKHNYTFAGTNIPRPPVNAFGLNYGVDNLTLDSNYITCQTRLGFNNTPVFKASVNGNKIIAGIPANYGYYLWGFTDIDFPQNTYVPAQPSSGLEYFVLPNKYERDRAHIAIYNWAGSDYVQINVSNSGLQAGDIFELVNLMDYYNDITTDTLSATGIISVPMTGHTFAPVIGSKKNPVSQFPTFGVFMIRKIGKSITTNIVKNQSNGFLKIYPNPSSSVCNISFSMDHPGDFNLAITDILGKPMVCQNTFNYNQGNQEIQLNTKDLQKGTYLILIHTGSSIMSAKFLKE
ncbi:MAG: T9SS type A sorting domain-containing protein [Saprospiraceae bacterium]|nr:T9SS type A sorting domain-containing protein [Saprospiraceae bacterium]